MQEGDPIESVLVAILLGKTKEQFGKLTPELNELWDKTVIEVRNIQADGGVVALPNEVD